MIAHHPDRRSAARLIALGALLPMAGVPVRPAIAETRGAVAVPGGEHRLERVLTRGLSDGKAIVVTRQWRCRFAALADGMRVSGEQQAVDVAAPGSLAAFAQMERARDASAMFPMALDPSGLIDPPRAAAAAAGPRPTPQLDRAIDTARLLFAALPDPAGSEARAFLADLARMSAEAVSVIPRDLFFPAAAATSQRRELALPGGGVGEIIVLASAVNDPASGLLVRSERRIVTRLAGSERVAAESWRLWQD